MLERCFQEGKIECGCDEAGRGCLAGPVFAGAVIFPQGFVCEELNDSKILTEAKRYELREVIQQNALAWAVAMLTNEEIDQINILNASFAAMNRAVRQLEVRPQLLLIDGPRYRDGLGIPYQCIVKGDGKYQSIAAASILAKTYRDDFMRKIDAEFPQYNWAKNKGYPTADHYAAIRQHGVCPYHRQSFRLYKP